MFPYSRNQDFDIAWPCIGRKIPPPQAHVEGGVLASHETGNPNALPSAKHERQQQQRPTLRVVGYNYRWRGVVTAADLPLPWRKKIESLIRRGVLAFELAPDRFCLA